MNENDFNEDEISASSVETQDEYIVSDNSGEVEQSDNGAETTNDSITTSVTEVMLVETQYNEIINSVSLLNHTNYLLCALLLTIFLYMFLSDLFERRKV